MNKILLLAAAAGLSVSLLAGVPSDAWAQGANAFPEVCKQLQEGNPEAFEEVFGNLGGCVSSPATLFCRLASTVVVEIRCPLAVGDAPPPPA